MKKLWFLPVMMLALPFMGRACDICGCGVGNNYIGILPDFQKTIFGVRYRFNSLLTHVGVGGSETYLTTQETYQTVETWGGYNIGKHFRLMAAVPYSFNGRNNHGVTSYKNGLGDVSMSAYYQPLNSRTSVGGGSLLVQSLWLGGGVKLATGGYNPADKSSSGDNINLFQLGTASTDFTLNGMYDVRLQDAGLNVSGNYKMNTTNKYEYRYGNKLSLNTQAYYKVRVKKLVTLAPNAGVQFENAQKDDDHGFDVDVSGGRLLMATAGVETAFKKISVGGNFQTPLSQDLGKGFAKAKDRFMIHVSLTL